MKQTYKLRYMIPKLNLNTKPANDQKYSVYIAEYDSSKSPSEQSYGASPKNCTCKRDGTLLLNSTNKVPLEYSLGTDLNPFTTYILKFHNTATQEDEYITFKTGMNISLEDSPYHNKMILPEQSYAVTYDSTLYNTAIGSSDECLFAYYLEDGKKIESTAWNYDENDNDLWPSLVVFPANTEKFDKGDSGITSSVDNNTIKIQGYHIDGNYFSFPHTHSSFYLEDADQNGCGGIRCTDIALGRVQIGCAFYIQSDAYNTKDGYITIMWYNYSNQGIRLYLEPDAEGSNKWRLKITETRSGTAETHELSENTLLSSNAWYYVQIGPYGSSLHFINDNGSSDNEGITSYTTQYGFSDYPGSDTYVRNSVGGANKAFFFGDSQTHGLLIAGIIGRRSHIPDNLIGRMLRPDLNSPYLQISDSVNGVWDNATYHTAINATKGEMTFYIESQFYENLDKTAQSIDVRIIKNHTSNEIIKSTIFSGFTAGSYSTTPLVSLPDYRQKEYMKIKFSELNNNEKINVLSENFFTKHGTWGGYNGGCSGHLVYFNSDGNLILEAHGDDYIPYGTALQHPKGVMKETLTNNGVGLAPMTSDMQTGYGEDCFWDGFTWDQRKYKNWLRTGSSLVSNKYYGYGRFSVTMKLPKLEWNKYDFGVCPALWYFHYIEVYPDSERYNNPPFDQRAEEGNIEDGYYKVLNNEIDIELPSQLTNGTTSSFSTLENCFFAEKYQTAVDYNHSTDQQPIDYNQLLIDNQTYIGLTVPNATYRFAGGRGTNPHSSSNWVDASSATRTGTIDGRNDPTFAHCKLNSWLGEYNSGDGWGEDEHKYFYGSPDGDLKEDYQSMLTRIAKNKNGYADGEFHKWSIDWTPNRVVLLIDDVPFRVCYGYIPVNQMKYTVALWFPTLKRGIYTEEGDAKQVNDNNPNGDFVYNNSTKQPITTVTDETNIGTWAGTRAYWETFHMEISEIEFTPYNNGHIVPAMEYVIEHEDGTENTVQIESEIVQWDNLHYYGETFPESGLRIFTS